MASTNATLPKQASGLSKTSSQPPLSMAQLQKLQQTLMQDLDQIERTIFQKETQYLTDSLPYGNVTKGWEGTGTGGTTQKVQTGGSRKQQKFT